MSDAYIAALHQERSDALASGLDDRVASIDAELAILDAPEVPEAPVSENPEAKAPSVETAEAPKPAKARRARKAS